MKIAESCILMTSRYDYREKYTREESLRAWIGDRTLAAARAADQSRIAAAAEDQPVLSAEGRKASAEGLGISGGALDDDDTVVITVPEKEKQKMLIIKKLLKVLTGKDINFVLPRIEIDKEGPTSAEAAGTRAQAPAEPQRRGWGVEYSYHESYHEKETLSVAARGIIKTADGREIDFEVQLNMSREFMRSKHIEFRAGDALRDPLVINYNGTAAELTGTRFRFDLDFDGSDDEIPFLRPGSGFLALDVNGDGVINDGRELFGAASGDGFAELAAYDEDQNGWVDENDPVFERLRIWTKDEAGNDVLFALGAKGIGAVYLGSIDAFFGFKDRDNALLGQARKAGVFVREDGTAGTVQQIDLVV
ncbi:MAG: hypothetical protein QMC81_05270 [Thermoanaerobacterales bacterium]|nr:hypothetical protein [Thermoanaerobacterales bacterium]